MLRWSGRDAPGLPEPARQAIRREPSGRRRYLDVEFRTRSGRRLVVEVDGALHLAVRSWWSDQFRQNEVVISDSPVLRFPSAFVRHEEALVIGQLRRALDL
jgi:very-short-patch-repair endonuclease